VIRKALAILALAPLVALPAAAEPPVRLTVKPLLCVLDRSTSACPMIFDIRWKSVRADAYCLSDSEQPAPLHCWASAFTGLLTQARQVSQDFSYLLTAPGDTQRLAEVKISVLRVDSTDRRRDRRTRHVWDVL
jgi:hypothetical protein